MKNKKVILFSTLIAVLLIIILVAVLIQLNKNQTQTVKQQNLDTDKSDSNLENEENNLSSDLENEEEGNSLSSDFENEEEGNGLSSDFEIQDGVLIKYIGKDDKITIPKTVTSIGKRAFTLCFNITSVIIPDTVTAIGSKAFFGCKKLENVEIPTSVTSFGDKAFMFTQWIEIKREENPIVVVNGILIDGFACEGDITLPETITTICDQAFSDNTGLTGVTIPEFVTYIGKEAFSNCMDLESVVMTDSVTYLGSYTFLNCSNLVKVNLSNSITTILEYTFDNCYNLKKVTIPNAVTSIGQTVFANCEMLRSVTMSDSVTSIEEYTFTFFDENFTLYGVEDSFVHKYAIDNNINFKIFDLEQDEVKIEIEDRKHTFGNTPNNINNGGMIAYDKESIYFITDKGIMRKSRFEDYTPTLLAGILATQNLNVTEEYIFFIEEAEALVRMRKDGSLRENIYIGYISSFLIVDEWIYCLDEEYVVRMRLDGSECENIMYVPCGNILYADNYLYCSEGYYECDTYEDIEKLNQAQVGIWRINLLTLETERIYTKAVYSPLIYENTFYFSAWDNEIGGMCFYRMPINSLKAQKISNSFYDCKNQYMDTLIVKSGDQILRMNYDCTNIVTLTEGFRAYIVDDVMYYNNDMAFMKLE